MANVLGELFQGIADAIRSKTGGTDKLAPNAFAAAIESIVVGPGSSGGSSGGTGGTTGSGLKFASGSFNTPSYDKVQPLIRFDACSALAGYNGNYVWEASPATAVLTSGTTYCVTLGNGVDFPKCEKLATFAGYLNCYVIGNKYLVTGNEDDNTYEEYVYFYSETSNKSVCIMLPQGYPADGVTIYNNPAIGTITVEHGLSEMPDFIAVYAAPSFLVNALTKFANLTAAWGMKSSFQGKTDILSAVSYGMAGTYSASVGLDNGTAGNGYIYCPDDASFVVGRSAAGTMQLVENCTYRWFAITGMGSVGSGSSDDVRYVTFRNASTGKEYVKAVATGDDCVDVVAKGLWATPTKESDEQYHYTFYGWGAEDGGAADSTILQNITENKTVYAIFSKTLRTYTITYLDEDGETVLKTETLAYGSMPSYTPSKEGSVFSGWDKELTTVTGDAIYTAVWTEVIGGSCGTNANWMLDSISGELTIYGNGKINSYLFEDPPWHEHKAFITKIVIEEGITEVGNHAFKMCTALTTITIPGSVTRIGNYAFNSCSSLRSVTIPEGVTHIGQQAFGSCTSLTTITIPGSVTRIGSYAFIATGLTSATFVQPSGWYYTSSSSTTSGTNLLESTLADTSTAATLLATTYASYFWGRS